MNALANGFSYPDSFARFAPAEWGGTPHTSTLAKARASVKNSRAGCCASANGAFCGAKCFESTLALFVRTRMSFGIGEMSSTEPLGAPPTILLGASVAGFIQPRNSLTKLWFGFCGRCVHCILHGRESGAGKRHSAGWFDHSDFVHTAAGNIHPPVGRRHHVAHR